MKVRELVKLLDSFSGDTEVYVSGADDMSFELTSRVELGVASDDGTVLVSLVPRAALYERKAS